MAPAGAGGTGHGLWLWADVTASEQSSEIHPPWSYTQPLCRPATAAVSSHTHWPNVLKAVSICPGFAAATAAPTAPMPGNGL